MMLLIPREPKIYYLRKQRHGTWNAHTGMIRNSEVLPLQKNVMKALPRNTGAEN